MQRNYDQLNILENCNRAHNWKYFRSVPGFASSASYEITRSVSLQPHARATRRCASRSTRADFPQTARMHGRWMKHAHWEAWENYFSFFFFSFFSFCEVITGVQYRRCFSRRYATTRAFLQVVQSSVFQYRWHL